jgi:hypothetical protein
LPSPLGGECQQGSVVPLTLKAESCSTSSLCRGAALSGAPDRRTRVFAAEHGNRILLQTVLANPSTNIIMMPADAGRYGEESKTFVVLGAEQQVSSYEMQDTDRCYTGQRDIAQAGDTESDSAGDSRAIYLLS